MSKLYTLFYQIFNNWLQVTRRDNPGLQAQMCKLLLTNWKATEPRYELVQLHVVCFYCLFQCLSVNHIYYLCSFRTCLCPNLQFLSNVQLASSHQTISSWPGLVIPLSNA